jgi:hypothetical protein
MEVTKEAVFSFFPGPAAIAVHNDRNMAGKSLFVDMV